MAARRPPRQRQHDHGCANGAKTSEVRYTPYGGVRVAWGSLPTNRKFTGYAREDAIGGIDFAQARYYDGVIGRFLSADTIYDGGLADPQGLNRYSYVKGHVMNATDPTGHGCGPTSTPSPGTLTCDSGGGNLSTGSIGDSSSSGLTAPGSGSSLAKQVVKTAITTLFEQLIEAVGKLATPNPTDAALGKVRKGIVDAKKEEKVIVLGRTMSRVNGTAEKLGVKAQTFDAPTGLSGEQLWEANKEWLEGKMKESYTIVNIGPDPARGPLKPGQIDFYAREMKLLDNTGYRETGNVYDVTMPDSNDGYWAKH